MDRNILVKHKNSKKFFFSGIWLFHDVIADSKVQKGKKIKWIISNTFLNVVTVSKFLSVNKNSLFVYNPWKTSLKIRVYFITRYQFHRPIWAVRKHLAHGRTNTFIFHLHLHRYEYCRNVQVTALGALVRNIVH